MKTIITARLSSVLFAALALTSCSPWTAEDRIALAKLEAKAQQGDPQALYNLGACYLNGLATYTNVGLAADCWRKAAEKGYAPAQLQYAHCFWRGTGVSQNISNAVHWFGRAALQGESEAQHNFGFAYLNGLGVPKDKSAAIMWLTKAASQGNAGSAFELAQLYIKDETGDPAIEAQGVQWLRKAAQMDYPAAQYN
ncbi:MAG TPA: tetratricopeptide repeat protein, partial [Clostridia bacterium]|nr:tetratricopeptide repeat protein [Clostridia bacterium]